MNDRSHDGRPRALIVGAIGLVMAVALSLILWIALLAWPSSIGVKAGLLPVVVCLAGWNLTLRSVLQASSLRRLPSSVSRQTFRWPRE